MPELDQLNESDSVAVVQTAPNTLGFFPIYLDASNCPFVRRDEKWIPLAEVPGFRRFEKARRRKLFDTARLEQV